MASDGSNNCYSAIPPGDLKVSAIGIAAPAHRQRSATALASLDGRSLAAQSGYVPSKLNFPSSAPSPLAKHRNAIL
jgi:hypothetical protein